MVHVVRVQSRICVGGPALHTILLSQGLSRTAGSRYETTLVGGALEPGEFSMSDFAEQRGVRIEALPEMGRAVRPHRDAAALAKMVGLLRKLRPEIVHTHTAKAGAIGRTAARIAGVPLVVHTFHGHVFDGYFDGPKARAFVAAERGLARLSDCVLSISERQRDELADVYRIAPREKIRVIPLGLELDAFRAIDGSTRGALRRELGLGDDAELVVTVGRLVPIKRFDLLIAAFEEVARQRPQAQLLIVGDGDAAVREDLHRRARRVSDRIHFLGLRRDLPKIYADADLFVLSSDNEGTPVAAIEALAAGVPVVATDVGGLRDILPLEAGELVPRGAVAELSRGILHQLSLHRRVGEQQRSTMIDRFSHHRLIRDVTRLYDDLLEAKASTARRFSRAAGSRKAEGTPC